MKRILAVFLVIVLAALGVATWDQPELMPWAHWWHRLQMAEPGQAVLPQSPASAASAAAGQGPGQEPVEQVGESADSATPLQEILPRTSMGHAQGLAATKDPLRLSASAALVVDADSGAELYAKNPDAVLPMASITKLMTAVVITEAKLPMDAVLTITEDDMDKERHSRSRLKVGTVLTRSEALHLALMSSENRAAHALARTYPEGLPKFVDAMNRKAKQLGMNHTTYVDPTGLATENQSTARDLATLVLAAEKYPELRAYTTDREHLVSLGRRNLLYRNSNTLVRAGWDIALQKTGYIVEAGHCVVMDTKVHGQDLVMVLLDSVSNGRRNADAEHLRSWWIAQTGGVDEHKLAAAKPHHPHKAASAPAKGEHHAAVAQAKPQKPHKHAPAKPQVQHEEEHKGKRVHAQFAAN